MISETKLDSLFPNAQFYMESFSKPYRIAKEEYNSIRQGRYPFEINKLFMY